MEYKTGDTIKSETWPSTSYALDGETEIITFSNRAFESLKISDRFLIRYEAVYGMTDLAFNPGGLIDVLAEVPECEGSEAS